MFAAHFKEMLLRFDILHIRYLQAIFISNFCRSENIFMNYANRNFCRLTMESNRRYYTCKLIKTIIFFKEYKEKTLAPFFSLVGVAQHVYYFLSKIYIFFMFMQDILNQIALRHWF